MKSLPYDDTLPGLAGGENEHTHALDVGGRGGQGGGGGAYVRALIHAPIGTEITVRVGFGGAAGVQGGRTEVEAVVDSSSVIDLRAFEGGISDTWRGGRGDSASVSLGSYVVGSFHGHGQRGEEGSSGGIGGAGGLGGRGGGSVLCMPMMISPTSITLDKSYGVGGGGGQGAAHDGGAFGDIGERGGPGVVIVSW